MACSLTWQASARKHLHAMSVCAGLTAQVGLGGNQQERHRQPSRLARCYLGGIWGHEGAFVCHLLGPSLCARSCSARLQGVRYIA